MAKLKIFQFSQKNRKIKGVTLIEMVVTICIISILCYLLIIKSSFLDQKLEDKELKELEISINNTRNYAIVTRKSQNISFDFLNNSYTTSFDNQIYNLKKLELKEPLSNRQSFTFTKNGSPSYSGAGKISLKGIKSNFTISVTPVTGKVNMRESNEKK